MLDYDERLSMVRRVNLKSKRVVKERSHRCKRCDEVFRDFGRFTKYCPKCVKPRGHVNKDGTRRS